MVSSPVIISRIEDFVANEAGEHFTNTPPTSPENDIKNEDPFVPLSYNNRSRRACAKRCLSKFPAESITEHRLNMLEMEKDCKDMLIMEQLQACGLSQGLKTRLGDRKRHKVNYQYENADVCRDCYLYINGIGIKYLKNLKKHMKKSGVVPRVHGNTNRKPKDAITFEDARRAVTFLIGYLFIFLSLILHLL